MINRLCAIAALSLLVSCSETEEKAITETDITGNWLVVSSDPQYSSDEERQVYAATKDSLIGPRGLKLIIIGEKGIFRQVDSTYAFPGSWIFNSKTRQFFVNNAGPGFHSFSGRVIGCNKDTMSIEEKCKLSTGVLPVIWHFKKIMADSPASHLFMADNNQWRIKPTHAEDEAALRKKVSDMFRYYAVYFSLVSREADYFSPKRVLLPVKYYQHGVGMREYDLAGNFRALFYNEDDARKAYNMVESAIRAEQRFPSGKDFVDEYALYFKQLQKAVSAAPERKNPE